MVQYRNAPLIELIAELRWDTHVGMSFPQNVQLPAGFQFQQIPFFAVDQGVSDRFLARFADACFKAGAASSERLVPPGFQTAPGQVTQRFRTAPSSPELYQAGAGVFTANAIPPYRSWSKFKPFVEKGISVLLESRLEDEARKPFNHVSLQYIDAFGPDLMKDMPPGKFITEVLGLSVGLPRDFQTSIDPQSSPSVHVQITTALTNGLILSLSVAEGSANNTPSVIATINVRAAEPVAPSVEQVMSVLNAAQQAQHNFFESMTAAIRVELGAL